MTPPKQRSGRVDCVVPLYIYIYIYIYINTHIYTHIYLSLYVDIDTIRFILKFDYTSRD